MKFIDKQGSFQIENPQLTSYLYFPIANDAGMKGAVTPLLGGDAKTSQNTFLLQPVSAEELHNNKSTRNFWCRIKGKGVVSLTGASAEQESKRFLQEEVRTTLEAGFMWHKLFHNMPEYGIASEILSFSPIGEDAVELMAVTLHNRTQEMIEAAPVAAIPIYGRSADNIRDHKHVTSLLHRIYTTEEGVVVNPTLTFDERGHKKNRVQYYVMGAEADGTKPVGFYPTVEEFIGEGGSLAMPRSLYAPKEEESLAPAGMEIDGYEALGGIAFAVKQIPAGESATWIVMMGIQEQEQVEDKEAWRQDCKRVFARFANEEQVSASFAETKHHWLAMQNVTYHTGEEAFDQYMNWVSFQPVLRRIYGCSFLPHHDYGKGGRGWRDLWQDCLALLMMNPNGVSRMLVDNYAGVRVDGSNATIIGTKQGEFIADRNHITRVWMDHGLWPLMTTDFYIQQTGDWKLLLEEVPYFKDAQIMRGTSHDTAWNDKSGCWQQDNQGKVSKGSILEHILIQHLTSFYEVGEHNHMRLRGADWNDALDMAEERGESVAFSAAYAGNFMTLAKLLQAFTADGMTEVMLLPELKTLLVKDKAVYEDIQRKQEALKAYCESCSHTVSSERVGFAVEELSNILTQMSEWMMEHIRKTEWISDADKGWFNSYYDNHGRAVEGSYENGIRMMLTGQVFAIMSETATKEQTADIIKAADAYLYDEKKGGYRLNTNFHEQKDDLGRMFGFAYGHKENGAVFSHMTTMYANALYQRGFAKEGYKALHTLYHQAADFETSRIYPGIPEYFNEKGRGMYHYLTGAASWYMMTVITQMYGVRGEMGDLALAPKLMENQFDEKGEAFVELPFAGKQLGICYRNQERLSFGEYVIGSVTLDEMVLNEKKVQQYSIERSILQGLSDREKHVIEVNLCKPDERKVKND